MHAAAFNALRTAQRPLSRRACRTIAGIRHPLPRRNFHRSAISYRTPPIEDKDGKEVAASSRRTGLEGPGSHNVPHELEGENTNPDQQLDQDSAELGSGRSEAEGIEEDAITLRSQESDTNPAIDEEELADDGTQQVDVKPRTLAQRRRDGLGSGRVRANHPRRPEGLPRVVVPNWFFSKNVKCSGEADLSTGTLGFSGQPASEASPNADATPEPKDGAESEINTLETAKYLINADIYKEIQLAVKAGLFLRPPKNIPTTSIPRPATLLYCPKDGGTLYLDTVVEKIAGEIGADLVRLDADDIAQLVGTYANEENLAWSWSKTSLLGYDTQRNGGRLEDPDKDLGSTEVEGEADEDSPVARISGFMKPFKIIAGPKSPLEALLNAARRSQSKGPTANDNAAKFEVWSPSGDSQQLKSASDQWSDLKATAVLNALILAGDAKRTGSSIDSTEETTSSTPIIVHVRDYKELSATPDGQELLTKLRVAINKRWFEGRPIMLVGTTSSEDIEMGFTKPEIQIIQSDIVYGEKRTIYVPPNQKTDDVFETDEKARIRSINLRHVEDMVSKLAGGNQDSSLTIDIENGLDNAAAFSADLEDTVWAYPRVHRLATTILGLNISPTNIDGVVLTEALKLLAASDEAKFAWGEAEMKKEDDEVDVMLQDFKDTSKAMKDKLKKIRSECSTHEKKLLGGVIVPSDIHTTFSDVRAPNETVEALKTLTSLSLIRPEAFSYGVLATDKIPGLLLYGPPGTGKTLLAKAVAKESGATVLEVSGAEVSDMYVGEGEKNVKAIFSLAKKLSPCVVFIDEADSLLGSRSGEFSKRSSHREVINQFLREWDGLKDLSAFIMVATNRPFDLDDAVLRRLPRRLLVDLPVEKDREAILKIHLKDEVLDSSVSLAALAKDTPFYSGSDLKNVSVAAAMACIRDENEVASKHTGEEPYVYPAKRTLMKHHFEKALLEISASISDEMSTLSAIRKFDEKYGDRRGRRKKAASMGFGGTSIPEKDSEAARVRKLEA